MKRSRHSSVRWRIALIYFLLIFIAMAIVSAFLLDRIEKYQLSSLESNIDRIVSESNLVSSLGNYDDLAGHGEEIQQMFDDSWTAGFTQEISIVSSGLEVVASTNGTLRGRSAPEVFDSDVIVDALVTGTRQSGDGKSGDIPVKNICYPIKARSSSGPTSPASTPS